MRLARRPIAAITIVLTLALGIPLASDTPAAAATTLSFSPAQPMARELTWVRGRLATRVVRPVNLQYYKPGAGWTILPLRYQGDGALGRTFSGGYFRFRPRAIAPYRSWRVVAPRVRINGRTYSGIISTAKRMTTVAQSASIRLVPAPIGQLQNTTTTDAIPVNLAFRPIRRGRVVYLQRFVSGGWRKVVSGRQDARGYATFLINKNAATSYSHRAVAASYNGAGPAVSAGSGKLTIKTKRFADEFTGSALNTNKWGYRQLNERNPAGKRACSESSRNAVEVANGTLRLQVERIPTTSLDYELTREDQCEDGQYYNGHIGTQGGRFKTTYGIMAARMRLAPFRGKHSAFWSQPTSGGGSEIDIMEYFGTRNNIQHKVYGPTGSDGRVFDLTRILGDNKTYTNSFHIFSVEWTPTVYIFRVDGIETFRTARFRSHVDQYLIASLLSSDYELPYIDGSKTHTTYVDWVRVWR